MLLPVSAIFFAVLVRSMLASMMRIFVALSAVQTALASDTEGNKEAAADVPIPVTI